MEDDGDAGFSGGESECYSDDDGICSGNGQEMEVEQEEEPIHEVIKQEELASEMNRLADDTKTVIGLPSQLCRIVLHHYRWNKESLIEKYFETESPEAFFKQTGLDFPLDLTYVGMPQPFRKGTCSICFDDKKLTGLTCSHRYCEACWENYLSTRFHEFPEPYVVCPEPNCKQLVDDECAMTLLKKDEDKKFYQRVLINSFVECNKLLKWCPAANCGRVIKLNNAEFRAVPVTCVCDYTFCFNCSNEWHEPIDCELLSKWRKKCTDDSETSNWLHANTKDCPKCHITIEKDGGCNHMTCRSVTCRFEFCWTCLGPWQPHGSGWYSCNRFDDKVAKEARTNQENSRAALQRYLHYYNRFANHQNSLKFENRRTLMYTYAFAFYLQPNNVTSIFEDNQRDLELATEQLSEILEREIDSSVDLVALKQKVQDKCHYVDQRRLVLLKHCAEAMGRRKQANPVKVSDSLGVSATTTPSVTPPPAASPSSGSDQQTPPKKTDFSIKAQLESKPSTSKFFNPHLSSQTFANALKAYETLMMELEKPGGIKPGPLLQLVREVDKLTYRGPNSKLSLGDAALDLSIKRKSENEGEVEFKIPKLDPESKNNGEDTLTKLSSLVGKAGSSMNASMAAVVKSSLNDNKDDADPRKVFTCLRCFEGFDGIEELSEHMIKTKHFGNTPKPSMGSSSPISPKSGLNVITSSRSCSYRYKCALCGFCNDSIDDHMRKQHSFKEPGDWIAAVKLVPI
ncbi:hypothetical protein FO519_005839 [Halicephalobus sp. NKZ332]|nr:hypothetical protein FO519_005839 [Halicephalobus sp. NKZ332]